MRQTSYIHKYAHNYSLFTTLDNEYDLQTVIIYDESKYVCCQRIAYKSASDLHAASSYKSVVQRVPNHLKMSRVPLVFFIVFAIVFSKFSYSYYIYHIHE